jgi:hypothetical protein
VPYLGVSMRVYMLFLSIPLILLSACHLVLDFNKPLDNSATCGNGVSEDGEECDMPAGFIECSEYNMVPETSGNQAYCNSDCILDLGGCRDGFCGNDKIDVGEDCDGPSIDDNAFCSDYGFTGGSLNCSNNCLLLFHECSGGCGNGSLENMEECDGIMYATDSTCEDRGFTEGIIGCNDDCTFDTSQCGDQVLVCDENTVYMDSDRNVCSTNRECRYPPMGGTPACVTALNMPPAFYSSCDVAMNNCEFGSFCYNGQSGDSIFGVCIPMCRPDEYVFEDGTQECPFGAQADSCLNFELSSGVTMNGCFIQCTNGGGECNAETDCYPHTSFGVTIEESSCLPPGSVEAEGNCEQHNDCMPGLICLNGICVTWTVE